MESNSLSQEQIDSYFIEYQKSGSVEIRNKIFENYNNIPSLIARRFVGRGVELDDLVQVASMSLLKAIGRFDVRRGIKFQSFAVPTIVGEIKNYFRDHNQKVKISRRNKEDIRRMKLAVNELSLELEKAPTTKQIAEKMGLEEENVLELMEISNNLNIASIDAFTNDEDHPSADNLLGGHEKGYEMVENRELLKISLEVLDEKERYVILERFFNNRSQQSIAKKLEVSQMYVSRAEKRALEKMRKVIRN